ncbi:hypothetical protein RYX36_015374, partial [Vicia faba]
VKIGPIITWNYPSVVLEGDESVGEFHSVALTNNYQQEDTGTKMLLKGKNTRSIIISKGISSTYSRNCYRGLVHVMSGADKAKSSSQCDSMLVEDTAATNTNPYIQRGIDYENAMSIMIVELCRDVIDDLPYEFASKTKQLLSLKLKGSVG